MEIRDLKVGDIFIKGDGKLCTLELLNDCRARIMVHGLSKTVVMDERFNIKEERSYNGYANVSPATEVLRVMKQEELATADRAATQRKKGDRKMKDQNSEVMDFSAKLPTDFVKSFKGKEYKLHRTGQNQWEVNGKPAGGIRDAMNSILEHHGGNNGRHIWSFFNCGLIAEKKAAEPKKEKAAAKKTPAKKAKGKKAKKAKKAKKKAATSEQLFSKDKQLGKNKSTTTEAA